MNCTALNFKIKFWMYRARGWAAACAVVPCAWGAPPDVLLATPVDAVALPADNKAATANPAVRLPAAQLRRNLVHVAIREWRAFGSPTYDWSTGTARPVRTGARETDTAWLPVQRGCTATDTARQRCKNNARFSPAPFNAVERVVRYWQVGLPDEYGDYFLGMAAAQRATWVGSNANPWSAAFISYLMQQVGAGNRFPQQAAHSSYLRSIYRSATGAGASTGQFALLDATVTPVQPGDLVCAPRSDSDDPKIIQLVLLENLGDLSRLRRAHCDVVVAVHAHERSMEVIGGNVFDTVAKSVVPLAKNGIAVRILERPWFFLVRSR